MTEQTKVGPPPWSEAPEWAQWRAMDEDGDWYFYRARPARREMHWGERSPARPSPGYVGDSRGRGWIATLEARPTDTGDDWPGHTSPEARSIEDEPPEIDPETLRMFHEGVKSGEVNVVADMPGYESLRRALDDAYEQAAYGKGVQRHGQGGLPFDKQPMQHLIADHGLGFATGQAAKKSGEALGMDRDAARRELLGAIVYLAGAIVWVDNHEDATAYAALRGEAAAKERG